MKWMPGLIIAFSVSRRRNFWLRPGFIKAELQKIV